MTQLVVFTDRCRITTLALPECEMNAQDAERLEGVLDQCPALARLDLGGRVLRQCPPLTDLNLSYQAAHTHILCVSMQF